MQGPEQTLRTGRVPAALPSLAQSSSPSRGPSAAKTARAFPGTGWSREVTEGHPSGQPVRRAARAPGGRLDQSWTRAFRRTGNRSAGPRSTRSAAGSRPFTPSVSPDRRAATSRVPSGVPSLRQTCGLCRPSPARKSTPSPSGFRKEVTGSQSWQVGFGKERRGTVPAAVPSLVQRVIVPEAGTPKKRRWPAAVSSSSSGKGWTSRVPPGVPSVLQRPPANVRREVHAATESGEALGKAVRRVALLEVRRLPVPAGVPSLTQGWQPVAASKPA